MVLGEVASPGVAQGTAVLCGCGDAPLMASRPLGPADAQVELERFDAAVTRSEAELLGLQRKVLRETGRQESAIFESHAMLVRDPALRETVGALCLTRHLGVEEALTEAIEGLTRTLGNVEDPLLRERAADLRDVGGRLLEILAGDERPEAPSHPDGTILVTRELLPSVVAQLDGNAVRGVVVVQGGQTAHSTILARARGIPVLIRVPDATTSIRAGDDLIVDGLAGRVFVNPTQAIRAEYERVAADVQARRSALEELTDRPSVTRDGTPVRLRANIGKVADAVAAAGVNADGVGLYRTEFIFLAQDHFPSEEEQTRMVRASAEHLKPREVVVRALDIGSDKLLPYFPLTREANPSLGRRGTRLLLAHPAILHVQLRAILRVSATHPVTILFPMVGGLEDLQAAKASVERAKESLLAEGLPFDPQVRVGAMVETPAAVIMAEKLAEEADFLSIGTNDLVQYLLTTDRTSSDVASYYEPLHPAVLRALRSLAEVATRTGKSVSICGEMAGNPAFTKLLLGLGFRSLSVNPAELLEIRGAIRGTDLAEAESLAAEVLSKATAEEIKDCLRRRETAGW
jgi:phosphotransferase system enzyme I (PtsI)